MSFATLPDFFGEQQLLVQRGAPGCEMVIGPQGWDGQCDLTEPATDTADRESGSLPFLDGRCGIKWQDTEYLHNELGRKRLESMLWGLSPL